MNRATGECNAVRDDGFNDLIRKLELAIDDNRKAARNPRLS